MRQGQLPPAHLELAALMLHPPAKRVLGTDDSLVRWTETVGVWNFERWLRKLSAWGMIPLARAAIAAGWWVSKPTDSPAVARTLEAAERWVLSPGSGKLQKVVRAAHAVRLASTHDNRAQQLSWLALALADALEAGQAPIRAALLASKLAADPVELRLAMCDEVTRWVLGYGDPVAERTRRRRTPVA